MLFGPDGAPLTGSESDDIAKGFQYLAEQIAQRKPAFYLGTTGNGYALLVGSHQRFEVAGGIAIGVSLTPVALAALRDRVFELLHGPRAVGALKKQGLGG